MKHLNAMEPIGMHMHFQQPQVLRPVHSTTNARWVILSGGPLTLTRAKHNNLSHNNSTITAATQPSLEALGQPA